MDDVVASWSLVSDEEEEEESLRWGGSGRITKVLPRPVMASAVVTVRHDARVVMIMNHDHGPALQRKPMRDGRILRRVGYLKTDRFQPQNRAMNSFFTRVNDAVY